jgi:hypothetical protein
MMLYCLLIETGEQVEKELFLNMYTGVEKELRVVTDQSWKIQPTQRHTVTGGCMCRIRRLLMMGARVPETCRAE